MAIGKMLEFSPPDLLRYGYWEVDLEPVAAHKHYLGCISVVCEILLRVSRGNCQYSCCSMHRLCLVEFFFAAACLGNIRFGS